MMDIRKLEKQTLEQIEKTSDENGLRIFEKQWLGPKGKIRELFRELKNFEPEERKKIGGEINLLKKELTAALEKKRTGAEKEKQGFVLEKEWLDATRPVKPAEIGHIHLLTSALKDIALIFKNLGFDSVSGPDIETEWNNFDALNIPAYHPARETADTFWLNQMSNVKSQKLLLRTHTSPSQIRHLLSHKPPCRIVSPGKVYRFEAIDASHNIEFWQLEGLAVDKNINFANLLDILRTFLKEFFKEKNLKIRIRPSYYPFVEPGIDIDLSFDGKKWIEAAGAGMVHPNVLKNTKLNPEGWQGIAFGIGVDRLIMLKHKIPDIRLLHSADLRFLKQF
ncbi:MAG: phenylalanine--tRNA ligase subunit alpha [Candidatus Niyogibacteria bacterium RIFCSPLOWO2_12_FULL_41_13]|uniref:Phenylalanine--tRNA ligase alpha subunit n=1 Tax=Candidatus Niyogibacteria bacterium RIFCSPLOWO2_12_FULL_41_13 TaxID=1801726 RepID=A0A1G2F1G4_9BACT|nr:MAG: phenylalanine--tRNA ligase subunit alpha [Candidatus Niyogibacteria bacterium RIFCSPLOWO2_12_FULL_41_13]